MSRTSAVEPAKRGACLAFLAASLDYMYLRQGATPPTTPALGEQASTAVTALFNRMIQQPPPEVSIEGPEIKCTLVHTGCVSPTQSMYIMSLLCYGWWSNVILVPVSGCSTHK